MAGFKGRFKHNMDSKGRVALPAAFRKNLGSVVSLVPGLSSALYVVPEDRFDEWVDESKFFKEGEALKIEPGALDELRHRIYADSADADIDSAGRIVVPERLLEELGIAPKQGASVTFVGQRNHFELWKSDAWDEYRASLRPLRELTGSQRTE